MLKHELLSLYIQAIETLHMALPTNPQKKFVTHKTLSEGWTYISTSDNTIIGVKVSITKVSRLETTDGTPVKDPAGNGIYEFQSTNIVKILNREEWETIRKEGEGSLMV